SETSRLSPGSTPLPGFRSGANISIMLPSRTEVKFLQYESAGFCQNDVGLVDEMNDAPAQFTRNTIDVHGSIGAEWLRRLPGLISECESRWSMTVQRPFEHLSYNYVAPAIRSDGAPAILKMGVPNIELKTEIEALRLFDGQGIVRLLDADPERGLLLLE